MQALLSVMMAGMNAILGGAKADPAILVGSFGIYYNGNTYFNTYF